MMTLIDTAFVDTRLRAPAIFQSTTWNIQEMMGEQAHYEEGHAADVGDCP